MKAIFDLKTTLNNVEESIEFIVALKKIFEVKLKKWMFIGT